MSTPQQRDRNMQVFLAQARGRERNAELTRSLANMAIRVRAARQNPEAVVDAKDPIMEMLTAVTNALEAVGIEYAITGALASFIHGEAQSTADADLVILADANQATRLSAELSPRFYAPADMLQDAASKHGFVNVVDNRVSAKADLSFASPDSYLMDCIRRRIRGTLGPGTPEFWFVTPEDIILMKLLWRKDTRSTKQWENALSVVRVLGVRMDWKYLFEKARELGVEEDLETLRDEAGV